MAQFMYPIKITGDLIALSKIVNTKG